MNRTLCILLAAASLAAFSGGPVAAQQIDSPYRFLEHSQHAGIRVGYLGTGGGRIDAGPQAGLLIGADWAIRVMGPFMAGVEVGFAPMKRTVRDTTFVTADSVFTPLGEADVGLLLAFANMRFNVTGARTWHSLQPFLLLGVGVATDVAGDSELDADLPASARFDHGTSFAGQLGAGVEWFPSTRIGVRLDARNALWKLKVPEAFILTERGRTLPASEWEQNYLVSVGMAFHF